MRAQRPGGDARVLPPPRARRALARWAALALLAAGCALKGGPGKLDVEPTWKRYVVEHPVALGERTLRSGALEVRLERVVVEEHRTVLGPESWLGVLHVVVVNHGEVPVLVDDLAGTFQLLTRSGSALRGAVFPDGSRHGGWSVQKPAERYQLMPGGAGRVRVQAGVGTKERRDDLSAMTFRDVRLDFR
jgi:hypothetical protein